MGYLVLGVILWGVGVVLIDFYTQPKITPDLEDDEDDDGGHREPIFPDFGPVGGLKMEDLLVDRLPDDGIFQKKNVMCLN